MEEENDLPSSHPESWHVSSLIKSKDFLGFTSVSSEAQFDGEGN